MNLPLTALTGSEPLAFLAALGALRGAARQWPTAGLSWTGEAPFQPELQLPDDTTSNALIETLMAALQETEKLECFAKLGSDVKVTPEFYGQLLTEFSERDDDTSRASLEYLYALGNEMVADGSGKKLKPSAWHMTAGQQQFLDMTGILLRDTTAEHLDAALSKRGNMPTLRPRCGGIPPENVSTLWKRATRAACKSAQSAEQTHLDFLRSRSSPSRSSIVAY